MRTRHNKCTENKLSTTTATVAAATRLWITTSTVAVAVTAPAPSTVALIEHNSTRFYFYCTKCGKEKQQPAFKWWNDCDVHFSCRLCTEITNKIMYVRVLMCVLTLFSWLCYYYFLFYFSSFKSHICICLLKAWRWIERNKRKKKKKKRHEETAAN